MRKQKWTYSEGFFFEARVLGDETHAKTGAVQIGRAFGRVHPVRPDVADVVARARDGYSAAGHSAGTYPGRSDHRRSGGQCRRRHRVVPHHDGIAPRRVAVNAAEILRRHAATVNQMAVVNIKTRLR